MTTKPMWDEIDFRLSVVNRWQVVPTIRKQSVAEHQHNVAKLAERLALEVFEWDRDDTRLHELVHRALTHDDLEAIIGDPPSYTKSWVNEENMASAFAPMLREPLYGLDPSPDMRFIIKAADYIDAAVFLRVEISMGNRTVAGVLRDLEYRFRARCVEYIDLNWPGTVSDPMAAYRAYEVIVDSMFNGNGQMTIEGFRF